ncbi:caspase domain-containing protein [Mucidula mucida]|nr:caspase domain-containing protein [Mucidula mucida]
MYYHLDFSHHTNYFVSPGASMAYGSRPGSSLWSVVEDRYPPYGHSPSSYEQPRSQYVCPTHTYHPPTTIPHTNGHPPARHSTTYVDDHTTRLDNDRGLMRRAAAHLFQYSKCTGRKKAVCIGINYYGHSRELRGCINDARHVYEFLTRHCGYRKEDIIVLTDDNPNKRRQPTRRNILAAMAWLVRDARSHDSLFFHYSGHGGRTRDVSGDELDGYDQVIYPVDYQTAGFIIDDFMHELLVRPLPMGCRLTTLFDCCHSGTVLDLPYGVRSSSQTAMLVSRQAWEAKKSSADVICWSGCLDGQKSADTFQGGVPVGAMSYAFITALKRNRNQSYQGLLKSIRQILYPKYKQTPQLASSHRIDTKLRFII